MGKLAAASVEVAGVGMRGGFILYLIKAGLLPVRCILYLMRAGLLPVRVRRPIARTEGRWPEGGRRRLTGRSLP